MSDRSDELLGAFQSSGEPETVDSMAAKMPGFSREAIAEALDTLAVAGVLRREKLPDGSEHFHYADPASYRLVETPVIKQPDPGPGRRR